MDGVNPKWVFYLGILITIEQAIGQGTVSLTNVVPGAWAPYIVAWCNLLAFFGTVIMTALAGFSSSAHGPLVKLPPVPPAVKPVILFLACSLALLTMSACSDNQVQKVNATLDKYDHALDNFQAVTARFDTSIAKTSDTVGPHCTTAVAVGRDVADVVKGNDDALKALAVITQAIDQECTTLPQDVDAAIEVLSRAIAGGYAVLHEQ